MSNRVLVRTALVTAVGLGACTRVNPNSHSVQGPFAVWLEAFGGIERSSPTQKALGVRAGVPIAQSDAGQLFGVGGFQIQTFDGGHDNVFTAGLQGRRWLGDSPTWVGAEGTYNNWRVSDDEQNPLSNVFGLSGVIGRRIGEGSVSVWSSAGVLFFSEFTADRASVYEGGTGWQVNLGVELSNPLGRD